MKTAATLLVLMYVLYNLNAVIWLCGVVVVALAAAGLAVALWGQVWQ